MERLERKKGLEVVGRPIRNFHSANNHWGSSQPCPSWQNQVNTPQAQSAKGKESEIGYSLFPSTKENPCNGPPIRNDALVQSRIPPISTHWHMQQCREIGNAILTDRISSPRSTSVNVVDQRNPMCVSLSVSFRLSTGGTKPALH